MTNATTARRNRRIKAALLIAAAIVAFPVTIVILIRACNEARR